MTYTNEPQSPQEGKEPTSERAKLRANWIETIRRLEILGREIARVEGDPRANPLERMRYLLYVIESDAHAAMSHLLTDFESMNASNAYRDTNGVG